MLRPSWKSEDNYTVTVVSNAAEIGRLSEDVRALLPGAASTLDPRFFLASISERVWIPRLVVVRDGDALVGIFYAKERRIARISTGLVYADATLGEMVAAKPEYCQLVTSAGVRKLLSTRGIYGIRIVIAPEGLEHHAIMEASMSLRVDVRSTKNENHMVLPLTHDYETFLNTLGKRTRRNFRYYRRRAEAAKYEFVKTIAPAEFNHTAECLLRKAVVGANREGLDRALGMLLATDRPLLVGLRSPNQELVSIVGGWYNGGRAVVFFQMNDDQSLSPESLSIVTRAHLIEMLIAQGVENMIFWAGVGAPLSRYASYIPAVCIYLDQRSIGWRMFRRMHALTATLLPKGTTFAGWVVPVEPADPPS